MKKLFAYLTLTVGWVLAAILFGLSIAGLVYPLILAFSNSFWYLFLYLLEPFLFVFTYLYITLTIVITEIITERKEI